MRLHLCFVKNIYIRLQIIHMILQHYIFPIKILLFNDLIHLEKYFFLVQKMKENDLCNNDYRNIIIIIYK